MKKSLNNLNTLDKRGFTLVEVIVAFSVLILVIVASTNLLVTVIRSNNDNENTLVAYGLAQQGLEAIRNIRDSDWLLGANFQGNVGSTCLWLHQCLPGSVNGKKEDFVIDFYNDSGQSVSDTTPVGDIASIAPWRLTDVTPVTDGTTPALTATQLCTPVSENVTQNGNADVWYRPCSNPPSSAENTTVFSRYVEVEALGSTLKPTTVEKYLVSSVVDWTELGRPKEVRFTTELTNWKGGPL